MVVSSPACFSHVEGKNSLVNGLFRFCYVRFFFGFFSTRLTAMPSENQCMSSDALCGQCQLPLSMLLVYLNIGFLKYLLQEWFRETYSKLMASSRTCVLHSPHLGCGLELILAVYREVHAHSFVLKCLLQWHVHVQHYQHPRMAGLDACTWH